MAFIDDAVLPAGLDAGMADEIRASLSGQFWAWYQLHKDDKILSKNFLFFSLTIRVHDLRFIFEMIFGAE